MCRFIMYCVVCRTFASKTEFQINKYFEDFCIFEGLEI